MSRFFTCPHCGSDVPLRALACPKCGSDEETGWSEEAKYVHLLPERDEDSPSKRRHWHGPIAGGIALIVAASLVVVQGGIPPRYAALLLLLAVAAWYITTQTNLVRHLDPERRLFDELVIQARGDRELAERLIEYERRRSPELNRAQLCQKALDRLKYDRR